MEEWATAQDSTVSSVQVTMCKLDITQNNVKQGSDFEHGDSSTTHLCSSSSPSTVYYSARTESMMKDKHKFSSDLEFNIEHSKIHWSLLASSSTDGIASTDIDNLDDNLERLNDNLDENLERLNDNLDDNLERLTDNLDDNLERLNDNLDDNLERLTDNLEHFERLKRDGSRWGGFLTDFESLVVNEKIGEAAQAEIYAATLSGCYDCEVKVFKQECALRDLERQWPEGMMKSYTEIKLGKTGELLGDISSALQSRMKEYSKLACLHGGTLLKDEKFKNRFAFVMMGQWVTCERLVMP